MKASVVAMIAVGKSPWLAVSGDFFTGGEMGGEGGGSGCDGGGCGRGGVTVSGRGSVRLSSGGA